MSQIQTEYGFLHHHLSFHHQDPRFVTRPKILRAVSVDKRSPECCHATHPTFIKQRIPFIWTVAFISAHDMITALQVEPLHPLHPYLALMPLPPHVFFFLVKIHGKQTPQTSIWIAAFCSEERMLTLGYLLSNASWFFVFFGFLVCPSCSLTRIPRLLF